MPFIIPLFSFMIFFFPVEKENTQFGSKNRWFSNLTQQANAFIRINKILSNFEEKPQTPPWEEVHLQSSDEKTLKFGCDSLV